jgi:hypothetical protein
MTGNYNTPQTIGLAFHLAISVIGHSHCRIRVFPKAVLALPASQALKTEEEESNSVEPTWLISPLFQSLSHFVTLSTPFVNCDKVGNF